MLQQTGGLALLDTQLQQDTSWGRRLHWAQRLGLPLLLVLIAGASDPLRLSKRLQIPHKHQRLLIDFTRLRESINAVVYSNKSRKLEQADWWTLFIEDLHVKPEAAILLVCCQDPNWRIVFRWYYQWRHITQAEDALSISKKYHINGKSLGLKLRDLRIEEISKIRCPRPRKC